MQTEKSGTLGTGNDQTVFCLQGNGIDRAETAECNGKGWREDQSYTLNTVDRPAVAYSFDSLASNVPICIGNGQGDSANHLTLDVCQTLNCMHDPMAIMDNVQTIVTQQSYDQFAEDDKAATLKAKGGSYGGESENFSIDGTKVRRLTPLECERLQGYPDGWTDIGEWVDTKGKRHKESSDAARYKALGNSIALPPWRFVLYRLCMQLGHVGTMASLFDGIGGFPLIWEQINGKGTCLWASEVESFCIAVTKKRFSHVEENK